MYFLSRCKKLKFAILGNSYVITRRGGYYHMQKKSLVAPSSFQGSVFHIFLGVHASK